MTAPNPATLNIDDEATQIAILETMMWRPNGKPVHGEKNRTCEALGLTRYSLDKMIKRHGKPPGAREVGHRVPASTVAEMQRRRPSVSKLIRLAIVENADQDATLSDSSRMPTRTALSPTPLIPGGGRLDRRARAGEYSDQHGTLSEPQKSQVVRFPGSSSDDRPGGGSGGGGGDGTNATVEREKLKMWAQQAVPVGMSERERIEFTIGSALIILDAAKPDSIARTKALDQLSKAMFALEQLEPPKQIEPITPEELASLMSEAAHEMPDALLEPVIQTYMQRHGLTLVPTAKTGG